VVEIGIHGFLNSRNYVERARELGIKLITSDEVRSKGASNVAADAYSLASNGTDEVYLSIDLDAIDLSQVSGVSAPSVGGLRAGDVCIIAYEIAGRPLVECADLVELAPSLDPTRKSARVAATVLAYLAAGYHSRKKKIS
jgi:arginase family enzyme